MTTLLNALAKEFFPSDTFNILQSIGDTLAIAVANILANEEIMERENEKTQLLKISEAIASIKDYKELLKVIYYVIRPVFPFDNTGIFILEKNKNTIIEITNTEVLADFVSDTNTEAKKIGPFPSDVFDDNSWYYANSPIITTLQKEITYVNDSICKQQFDISIESGLNEMICGPLITRGEKIGAFYLSAKKQDLYEEKQSICLNRLQILLPLPSQIF